MGNRQLRPNDRNLSTKKTWIDKAGGFAQFVLQLFAMKGIPASYKLVLISIMDRVRPKGRGGAFPTHKTIGHDAGMDERTVRRALHRWRLLGVLDWKANHGLLSNEYHLLESPLVIRKHTSILIMQPAEVQTDNLTGPNRAFCPHPPGQNGRLTSTQVITDQRIRPDLAGPDIHGPEQDQKTVPEPGQDPEHSRDPGGSTMPRDRSFQVGGMPTSRGEDAMEKATKSLPRDAMVVWGYMQERTKAKLKVQLPGLQRWELVNLQKLIDTDGYGLEALKEMVECLTKDWLTVKTKLRIREDAPTLNTLLYKAAELKVMVTNPAMVTNPFVRTAAPSVKEDAQKAADEILKRRGKA